MCSQERRARVKGAEDQGEKRPNKKSSNNRDLGDCKETEVICSRPGMGVGWVGVGRVSRCRSLSCLPTE